MEIINYIEKIAKEAGLRVEGNSDDSISLWTSPFLGISLKISCDENQNISFYFTQRTTSWVYNGERTDLHDVIPIAFALYIKNLGICSLFCTDVYNPATGAEDEIYSKFLTPLQINNALVNRNNEDHNKYIDILVYSLIFFEHNFWNSFPGCPCNECRNRLGYEFDYTYEIEKDKFNKVIKSIGSTEELVNYCERTLPKWFYFRDFRKKISVIESKELHSILANINEDIKTETVNAINGKLFIGDAFSNYISSNKEKEIKTVFRKLGDEIPKILLLENRVVAVGKIYILSFNYDCSINKFQIEKDILKIRHEKEFQILFKPLSLQWTDKIDDSRFEDLIKDLLEREPNVLRVRKMAHTRERDGGVDLIVDWKILKEKVSSEATIPYEISKIIIQCKAYKDGVSKSQVPDIRDTIEYRNYDGYLLVVSSYLKKSLSDHLDKLRTDNKFWIDWWSRDEIEKKLKNNRDLIVLYNDIVQIIE